MGFPQDSFFSYNYNIVKYFGEMCWPNRENYVEIL